jgi:tryptophan-rich sensory protein
MDQPFKLSATFKYILAIILCESAGILSALFAVVKGNNWFDQLNKPTWNPPA